MTRLRYVLLISGVLLVAAAIAGVAQPSKGGAANHVHDDDHRDRQRHGERDTRQGLLRLRRAGERRDCRGGDQQGRTSRRSAIIDALKNAGIPDSDIQTTSVSLWPQTSSDGKTITGYQASNSVTVTRSIDKSGALVDAAVSAGANNVDGPNLSVSDQSVVLRAGAEARRRRREDAGAGDRRRRPG